MNWFDNNRTSKNTSEQTEAKNPLLAETKRGLFKMKPNRDAVYLGTKIDQVTDLVIESVPGGAVIRATGLASEPGVCQVQITPTTDDQPPVHGVLTYRQEAIHPQTPRNAASTLPRT